MSERTPGYAYSPYNLYDATDRLTLDNVLPDRVVVHKYYPSNAGQIANSVEVVTDEGVQRLPWQARYAFDDLAKICTHLSAGTHDISIVRLAFTKESDRQYIDSDCRRIAEVMPPNVFAMEGRSVTIGNVVLMGTLTSTEQVKAERQLLYDREKTEIDKDKTSILDLDHARIKIRNARVGEQHYYMPFDRGDAILAARVIAAIDGNNESFIDGGKIASHVWACMPTIERELFLSKRSEITGTAVHIKRPVLGILRTLTRLIHVTHETSGERFKLEGVADITLHAEPPGSSELQGLRPVFPPGTDKEVIRQAVGKPIPESAMAIAKVLLEHQLEAKAPLSNSQALTVLDYITDPDIKRAIRVCIKETAMKRTSARVLEMLRGQVASALGEIYESTWRNRMIAGNHATGGYARARLIGGELPITTNAARYATKKWHIGDIIA